MSTTTCSVSLRPCEKQAEVDILRGVGLAVSLMIIFALPLGMVLLAGLKN